MKRNFLLLLCVIALMAACLASCAHQHTFSEEWYNQDPTNHWHRATCEHGEVKDSLAPHVDANEDGICDVCAYDMKHVHTFVDEWSYDDDNHWKAATCSHTEEKGELDLHSDEDLDGNCDVCSGHVHDVNATGYCKYEDCGKKVKDVDENDLEALANAILSQQGLINGFTAEYSFNGPSNNPDFHNTKTDQMDSYNRSVKENISVLFGKDNYTYSKVENESTSGTTVKEGTTESWYQLEGAEETFGMVSIDGGSLALSSSDINRLYGYYYTVSTLADGHGTENLLYNLYLASQADSASDFEIEYNADENEVSFSFNALVVNEIAGSSSGGTGDLTNNADTSNSTVIYNVSYYEVEVSFAYTDNFVLTDFSVSCDTYTNDAGQLFDYSPNLLDVDIEYDPDTNTFKYVKYNTNTKEFEDADSALADTYVYTVTQTIGDRTEENPNPKVNFIPDSYDIYTEKVNFEYADDDEPKYELKNPIADSVTMTVKVDDVINLYFGNFSPEGTSVHYAPEYLTFVIYDKDGNAFENVDDMNNIHPVIPASLTFSGELRSIFVIPKVAGQYRLEISFMGEVTHVVNIIAGEIDEDEVVVGDNEVAVTLTSADVGRWNKELSFTAEKAGKYKFYLPEGIGAINADSFDNSPGTTLPYYDYNLDMNKDQDGNFIAGSFSVNLKEGETIRFYINGANRGTYIISYEVK